MAEMCACTGPPSYLFTTTNPICARCKKPRQWYLLPVPARGPGAGEYKPVATAELVEDDDDLAFDEEYGYGGVR